MYKPNEYLSNQKLTELLLFYSNKFSSLCDLETVMETDGGNKLYFLTITDKTSGNHNTKPAFWVDGGTHSLELTSTQVCLHLINELLVNPNKHDFIKDLLQKYTFYILPRISPDGVEQVFKTGEYVRSSNKIYPSPHFVEGLIPRDINGDGEVLFMRKKDPCGRWKISKKDSRIMIPRGIAEECPSDDFYFILCEGLFENFDGFKQKDTNNWGLDFNRNYPSDWAPEGQTTGAGKFPLSEPETRVVVELISERTNIVIVQSFHTFSGVTLRPFANKSDSEMPPHDLYVYKELGKINEKHTGYECLSVNHDFKYHPNILMTGSFLEWSYSQAGLYTFCTELWNLKDLVGLKKNYIPDAFNGYSEDDFIKIIKYLDSEGVSPDHYVEWKAFDHPQLGEVEIGGWKPLKLIYNPPEKYLKNEVSKNVSSILEQTLSLPIVEIKSADVIELGDDIKKICIILENVGALPTYGAEMSKKLKAIAKPSVELSFSDDISLLEGASHFEFEHLEGRTQNYVISNLYMGISDFNTHQTKLEWIVKGSGKVSLVFTVGKAGVISKKIDI
jgi:murein tripeptide amidase MpaA